MVLAIASGARLIVDVIPGGCTVTENGNEKRWWSVMFRGSSPRIASHLCEPVDPRSPLARRVLAAVREAMTPMRDDDSGGDEKLCPCGAPRVDIRTGEPLCEDCAVALACE